MGALAHFYGTAGLSGAGTSAVAPLARRAFFLESTFLIRITQNGRRPDPVTGKVHVLVITVIPTRDTY
jgi:hypothetical protein